MKTIGLIGGLSYISTIEYYRRINKKVNKKLGGKNSAKIILNSINHEEIRQYNYKNWNKVGEILKREILKLNNCGVDLILMCNNTQHKAYDIIESELNIKTPFFHIVDTLGEFAKLKNFKNLLLLGTKFTMEDGFYTKRLKEKFNMNIIIPIEQDRIEIDRIIQEELLNEKFLESSKVWLLNTIKKYSFDSVILACTELPLIIKPEDCNIPILDTLEIHCDKAVNYSLEE